MSDAVDWVESLSPWPADGFGLDRMLRLLAGLGNPQTAFPAIHVVGTNGKSTTTRMIEALLVHEGLRAGSTVSPHVESWSERIRVDGRDADLDLVVGRVRDASVLVGATQFEVLTAAAFAEFADARVDVAVVEAGLGGRLDATNVLRTRVVVLTNVALEHTTVLGDTRELIAAEKLAVVQPGCAVVVGEPEWVDLAWERGPASVEAVGGDLVSLAVVAASRFLGRPVDRAVAERVRLPGRLERRDGEIRDGAHNPHGVRYLLSRLEPRERTVVMGVLADKDVEEMLRLLATTASRLVATMPSSPRAFSAADLARVAAPHFAFVEVEPDPVAAVARAHGYEAEVLVIGSISLLADLARSEEKI